MNSHNLSYNFKGLGVHYDCDHNRKVTEMFANCGCQTFECFGNRYFRNNHGRKECGLGCTNVTCLNQNLQWLNPNIINKLIVQESGAKGNGFFVYNVHWPEHTVMCESTEEVMDNLRYE